MKQIKIGVLAFHGDVIEHINALTEAVKKLKLSVLVVEVRTKEDLKDLAGLIVPGGESTTLIKLCQREGMVEKMKKLPAIFGTCAGAIMLAKVIKHQAPNQKTLGLMDIEVDRNAYGTQVDSFEEEFATRLGKIKAIFIRAPKILKVSKYTKILAEKEKQILACEQKVNGKYYLVACFHPELTTTKFHEYFLKQVLTKN